MKYVLTISALCLCLVGCGKKEAPSSQPKAETTPKTEPEEETKNPQSTPVVTANIDNPIVEAAIRKEIKKPNGELTKADLEKVAKLNLRNNQLTDVKGLEKLTQLFLLYLSDNPDLTKAQIAELQKALPNCKIIHNAKK